MILEKNSKFILDVVVSVEVLGVLSGAEAGMYQITK